MPAPINLRRLAWALALVPMVPALSGIIMQGVGSAFSAAWFDELRIWNAATAALAIVGALLIFRTAVVWTLGRGVLAAIINLVPFVQVAFNQPLWKPSACGMDSWLIVAQGQLGVAFWVWLGVWTWWVWEKRTSGRATAAGSDRVRRIPMTSAERRIAACLGVIPFSFAVFFIASVACEDLTGRSDWSYVVGYFTAALMMTAAWQFLWRGCVAWSRRVVKLTVALWCALLAAPIGLIALALGLAVMSGSAWMEAAIWLTPVVGWGLWMGGTMLLWPLKASALGLDPPAPRCLACGYDLTGLYATRCPECGSQPTLDELWNQRSDGIQARMGPPC